MIQVEHFERYPSQFWLHCVEIRQMGSRGRGGEGGGGGWLLLNFTGHSAMPGAGRCLWVDMWPALTWPALTSSWKDRKQASCQYNTLPYWIKIPVPFSSWIVIHGHHYLLVLLTTLFKSYWTKDKWGSEKEKESISIGMLHLFAPSVATQKKILFFYKFELLKANSVIQSTMIQYKQQMLQFQTQWYGIDIKWFSSKHSNITKKCSNWKQWYGINSKCSIWKTVIIRYKQQILHFKAQWLGINKNIFQFKTHW